MKRLRHTLKKKKTHALHVYLTSARINALTSRSPGYRKKSLCVCAEAVMLILDAKCWRMAEEAVWQLSTGGVFSVSQSSCCLVIITFFFTPHLCPCWSTPHFNLSGFILCRSTCSILTPNISSGLCINKNFPQNLLMNNLTLSRAKYCLLGVF